MSSIKNHWNSIYKAKEITQLSWYEEKPSKSLDLLNKCNIDKSEAILDIGCGATTFIDNLLDIGYKNIIGVDISDIALNKLKERLGSKSNFVKLIQDDITDPKNIYEIENVSLWHDRACLHFLVEKEKQDTYLSVLKKLVKKGGYVILATFSLKGAKKCSGLDVKRYDQDMLSEFLGDEFDLIEYFECIYTMPSKNKRPYVYTLFKRV